MLKQGMFFFNTQLRQSERLDRNYSVFPLVAIISFGFALVFVGVLLPSLNMHLGSPAVPIVLSAERAKEGSIWLSVKLVDENLVITTADRHVFRLPKKIDQPKTMAEFAAYLRSLLQAEIKGAALANEITETEISAVISVDQHLKYLHIRPVINALAEAGIVNYAFETLLLNTANTHQGENDHHDAKHL